MYRYQTGGGDHADLDKPFASYNAELLNILIPELDRRLEQKTHNVTLAEQIRWGLRRRLTAGRSDIRSVATELAMSERSLQRKLTNEELTFQNLLGETRHQLAFEHLADPTLTIIEIAYMLGYEGRNSFFRAFPAMGRTSLFCIAGKTRACERRIGGMNTKMTL